MTGTAPRVVLLSLDAFAHDAVGPDLTPHLWALAATGGRAPDGGRCPLPSATYTSHATLLTGKLPTGHGVWSGLAAAPRPGVVPGWAGAAVVQAPTLFDACRAGNVRCASIVADFYLHPILRAEVADLAWPPGGVPPDDAPRDAFGYLAHDAVRPHLLAAAADPALPFLFGHVNEPDTFGHRYGPDHPATRACHAATDQLVGELLDALRDDWARTVVIVTSDHGMAPVPITPPIDPLADEAVRELAAEALPQGGCGLVRPRRGIEPETLATALIAMPGVAAARVVGPELVLAEAHPGGWFQTANPKGLKGTHGGRDTTRTLAVVGGGHPSIPKIAASIGARPPAMADWAPTIAALLGVELSGSDGCDLAAG